MLKFSRLACRTFDIAFGIAGACFVGLAITPAASADAVFRISDGLYVWSGPGGTGMANQLSAGNWVGSGWDSFPGVSPPPELIYVSVNGERVLVPASIR